MKRIFFALPWVLVLALGGILTLSAQTKPLGVPVPFTPLAPLPSNPSTPSIPSAVTTARIVDGDTIDLSNGKRLRYIGVDTPESGDCFGSEATKKNKELVLDKEVRLEKDISETDKYGRLLRYVWARLPDGQVGDTMVNEEMVRQGYAKVFTYPPDVKYADKFVAAEREARENKRGLWADDVCNTEGDATAVTGSSTSCQIKGNINASGEKIYHLPGCGSYNKTTINESAGEYWFCSEDEAVSSGWRKAKNC